MLLNQVFCAFKFEKESYCGKKTLIYYDENISRFLGYAAKRCSCSVEELDTSIVTRDFIIAYLSHLRTLGVTNTTVNTYFRAVKVFMSYCMDEGYISDNVLRRVKYLRSDQKPIVPLMQDEVSCIDALFDKDAEQGLRNYCIIHLMLDAGFRCSDVVNLNISDINFENHYLIVQGKGSKYRCVPMSQRLEKYILTYILKYRENVKCEPLFVSLRRKGEYLTLNAIKQLFQKIKKSTGIVRLHPHMLRHTFATSYIMGGGNLEFLRLMLGHSDYETTKIYLHLAQQSMMIKANIYRLDSDFFKTGY